MKRIFAISLFFQTISSFGQFEFNTDNFINELVGEVRSDRPGKALNAQTCGFITLQLQAGFNYEQISFDQSKYFSSFNSPWDVKLGLSNKLELNSSFFYQSANFFLNGIDTTIRIQGMYSPNIGIRYTFLSGKRYLPTLALQTSLSFPSSAGTFQQSKMGSTFMLISQNNFNKLSVTTNLGVMFWGNNNKDYSIPYVVNLSYQLKSNIQVFGEAFGRIDQQELNFDAGVGINLGKDFILDASGGYFLQSLSGIHWFAEVGITGRISFLKIAAKKKADQIFSK